MPKTRILIVDDEVAARRYLHHLLNDFPDMEVVGAVPNGHLALKKIPQVNPDIIILDMEMPGFTGLQTLLQIRKIYPELPVFMFANDTKTQASLIYDALAAGATDYISKPIPIPHTPREGKKLGRELFSKLKPFLPPNARGATEKLPPAFHSNSTEEPVGAKTSAPRPEPPAPRRRVDIVAIGVSTGGPHALARVFSGFAADFPVPILIVQHMPTSFIPLLALRLSSDSRIPVAEARSGETLAPGKAWLAPGDFHLEIKALGDGKVIQTHQGPPENSCRPAVDVLFRSVAETFGPHSLAVVLTGMGQDGFRGCERISEAGGQILVQDQSTSVVWGMPGMVARSGLADKILPLNAIADEINLRVSVERDPSSSVEKCTH